MATRKNTASKARVSRPINLSEIQLKISEAWDVLECAYVALEDGEPGKESACFRHGLDMLGAAYSELDKALSAKAHGDDNA